MPYGLYLSADGAHAQSTRLEVIANNLANVDTVGFKRDLAVFQARHAEAIEQGLEAPGSGSISDIGGGIMVRQTKTDFSQGPMKRTGDRLDMAIRGEGFFVVRKDEQEYLTRAGNFRLTSAGELITQNGDPVLNDAGSPIVITDNQWDVTPAGAIRQAGSLQYLALVKPESLGDLVKVGENLFRALADPQSVPLAQRSVASGYVELSGVQPTTEMVELIEASRAVEANVRMMQTQDQTLSGLVNRLMKS